MQLICICQDVPLYITDTTHLKNNPEQYGVWKLEQLINYWLDGEIIDTELLIKGTSLNNLTRIPDSFRLR